MTWRSSELDQSSLRRLAEQGLAAFPSFRLRDAADWCWECGGSTGDARWCLLSRTLERLVAETAADGASLVRLIGRVMTLAAVRDVSIEEPHIGDVVRQVYGTGRA